MKFIKQTNNPPIKAKQAPKKQMTQNPELTEHSPEFQFVVRFIGYRFGITCSSQVLDKIDPKTLFFLIIEDTQQQQQPSLIRATEHE